MPLRIVSPDFLPLLRIRLHGAGQVIEVDAVVDTGFNGALSLSQEIFALVAAPPGQLVEATLADGSTVFTPTFQVGVEWNEAVIRVEATLTAGIALIGTALLQNHKLQIEVRDGGGVLIEPLS